MPHYRINCSDTNGNHKIIESTFHIYEDAEDWASDKEQIRGVRKHIHGLEQTNENIQVWEFQKITGIGASILSLIRGW